jgi:hypothetical protein
MRTLPLLLLCGIAVAPIAARAGNRTLQTPARFATATTTQKRQIFAGDFTADGKQDVLVGEIGKVHVFAGSNDGLFAAAVISDAPGLVAEGLADFNGDARPDLYLIGAGGGGEIAVMFGAANGSFGAPVAVPSSVPAGQLVAGDFTGDGLRDLGVVSGATHQIAILAGDGNGGFPSSQVTAIALDGTVGDAVPGDFDGDGHLDIALVTSLSNVVAWNDGTSFTTTKIDYWGTSSMAAGDIDGDGLADIATSTLYYTIVYFGKATRALAPIAFMGRAGSVTVAAVDGDARADIVSGGDYLTVLTHDGTAFRPLRSFGTGSDATAGVAVADFTGDGKADVVALPYRFDQPGVTTGTFFDYFSLIRGHGDGTLGADRVTDFERLSASEIWGSEAFLADVNGDSKLDIVADTAFQTKLAVLSGRGDGTFAAPVFTTLPSSRGDSISGAGDLNGDGRGDAILWRPGAPYETITFHALFGQADGTFLIAAAQTTPNGTGKAPSLKSVTDFTGDGKVDLLDSAGRIVPGLGGGTFGTAIATGINSSGDHLDVADVNGDGRPDLLLSAGVVYLNTGGGTFAAAVRGPGFGSPCTGDMNGDGLADIINDGIRLGDGTGHFAPSSFILDVNGERGICGVADIDGDGKQDVITGSAAYFGTGGETFDAVAATSGGTYNGWLLAATDDIDGNGSPDIWFFEGGRLRIIPTRLGDNGTAPSTMTVTTDPNPSGYPSPISPFATVAAAGIKPRGAVLFTYGSEARRTLGLVDRNGIATSAHVTYPVGTTVDISATFLGDEHYAPSSASSTHMVGRGPTKIVLTTSKSTYTIGEAVVMTETFTSTPYGAPTGTITFRKGATVLSTVDLVSSRTLTISSESTFPIGTHTLTVEYSGDANFQPSQSAPVTITITKVSPAITLAIPAGPLSDAQQATLTASFPSQNDVTGSVTFSCFGQTLGTAVVANAQAAVTAMLPWGTGECTAQYGGSDQYGPSSKSALATVDHRALPLAPLITATAIPDGGHSVSLAISPISGAASYDIYRSVGGAGLTFLTNTASPAYSDLVNPPTATVAVYAAVARSGTGTSTPMGPADLVSFVTFTDDPLVASTIIIKAVHLTELQTAINAVRLAAGLTSTTFATPAGTISAGDLTSLREALTQARSALGLPTAITDPTLTPGVTPVRAIHLQELRDAVK